MQILLQDPLNAIFHIKFWFCESFEIPFLKKKEQNGKYRKYETMYVLFLDGHISEHLLVHTLPLISFLSHGLATEHSIIS